MLIVLRDMLIVLGDMLIVLGDMLIVLEEILIVQRNLLIILRNLLIFLRDMLIILRNMLIVLRDVLTVIFIDYSVLWLLELLCGRSERVDWSIGLSEYLYRLVDLGLRWGRSIEGELVEGVGFVIFLLSIWIEWVIDGIDGRWEFSDEIVDWLGVVYTLCNNQEIILLCQCPSNTGLLIQFDWLDGVALIEIRTIIYLIIWET